MSAVRLAALTTILALALTGCSNSDTSTESATTGTHATRDRGDLVLSYEKPADEDERFLIDVIRERSNIEALVEGLNEAIALPRDIDVTVGGSDGPYYDPSAIEIVMSPDFVAYVGTLFAEDRSEQEVLESTGMVLDYVFLHEVGHALIDQLELPTTGREEDAVDELATVVSTELLESEEMALAAAEMFGLAGDDREELVDADFWDEHSLDEQRFYTIVCHVYGSDPGEYADLAADIGIDDDRLSRCPDEYEDKVAAWSTLLDPHLKE